MKSASAGKILKRGYLLKQSEVLKQWHLRYFVLSKECLCYYRNEQESKENAPKELIFFNDMSLYIDELPDKQTKYCLKIVKKSLSPKVASRMIFLCCFSEHERNEWLSQILHAKAISLVVDPASWIGNQEDSTEHSNGAEVSNLLRKGRRTSATQILQKCRRKFSLGGNISGVYSSSCRILDDLDINKRRKSIAVRQEWRNTLMVI